MVRPSRTPEPDKQTDEAGEDQRVHFPQQLQPEVKREDQRRRAQDVLAPPRGRSPGPPPLELAPVGLPRSAGAERCGGRAPAPPRPPRPGGRPPPDGPGRPPGGGRVAPKGSSARGGA